MWWCLGGLAALGAAATHLPTRCATNKTYGVSPGALVFHRDMLLPIPIITDLTLLRQKRQAIIDRNNLQENRRRRTHDYTVGDQILVLKKDPAALEARAEGPFTIFQVHSNGTVSFFRKANVIERINIRRIKPYYSAV